MPRFHDRNAAGDELAAAVRPEHPENLVVLAIPNGGVPVAARIAESFGAALDVFDVHELTGHREDLGVGDVRASGRAEVHPPAARAVGVDDEELHEQLVGHQTHLAHLFTRLRKQHPKTRLAGRDVVVVDDALLAIHAATAAADHARQEDAATVMLIVPAGLAEFVDGARHFFDDVTCLHELDGRADHATFYDDASPVSDDELLAVVASARAT